MNRAIIIGLTLLFVATASVAMYVPAAEAQQYTVTDPSGRGGKWEFILPVIYSTSTTIDGQGGSSLKVNDDWGFGFGFGYNFNEHFNLNGTLSWAYRSYEATVVENNGATSRYSNYMDTSTLALNGTYYLLKGNITPFITGGIGWTFVDSNIQNGPSSGTCWYDPWWGYVCSDYVPTKTEDDFSYNVGLGVRFDISREFTLQASYNRTWIDIQNATGGTPEFDAFKMEFIFRR